MLPRAAPATAPPNNCPLETLATPFPLVSGSYVRKYNTIAHHFLDSEAGAGDVTPQMYAVLDDLIAEASQRLTPIPANASPAQQRLFAQNALQTIDCILLRHGFVYPGRGLVALLSDGLGPTLYDIPLELDLLKNHEHNRRRARFISGPGPYYVVDCDTASYIYLAIGEVMKYPIHLIEIPGHNFVRWELDANNYFDFETMDGIATDDQHYIEGWGIPAAFAHRGGVLASMSAQEADAYHDATVAISWSWRRNVPKMIEFYLSSIRKHPTRDFAFNNLAWLYAASPVAGTRNGDEAVRNALQATTLFPSGDDLDTLGCAYAQAGQFDRAIDAEIKARASGYVPQGSNIDDDQAHFGHQTTCNDSSFGHDPLPFRPHTVRANSVTERNLLQLH
jgi:hypothetical protein